MNKEKFSIDAQPASRLDEAKEILRTLRRCRSRLNALQLDHPAAYADISVQLLKQSIAAEEAGHEAVQED